jgi:hypothetical protein
VFLWVVGSVRQWEAAAWCAAGQQQRYRQGGRRIGIYHGIWIDKDQGKHSHQDHQAQEHNQRTQIPQPVWIDTRAEGISAGSCSISSSNGDGSSINAIHQCSMAVLRQVNFHLAG